MSYRKLISCLWPVAIPILFFTACLDPEPVELPFFTVKTSSIDIDSSRLLGELVLNAEIQGLGSIEQLDHYGFLFSQNLSFVEAPSNILQSPYFYQGESTSTVTFKKTIRIENLKSGNNFYFRAFAQKEERMVLGATETYELNIDFEIRFLDRQNDLLIFDSKIKGIEDHIDIDSFGVLIATELDNLTFTNATNRKYAFQEDNTAVIDSLLVNFNTTYYFQLYVTGVDTLCGSIEAYRVRDGWKVLDGLGINTGVRDAIVVSNGTAAFLVGGCTALTSEVNTQCTDHINDNIYQFSSTVPNGNGSWSFYNQAPSPVQITEGVGFLLNKQIYAGFGLNGFGTSNFLINILNGQQLDDCGNEGFAKLSNAVSFATNNAAYFGTGKLATSANGTDNSFYQLIFNDNCIEVQAMPPLPIRIDGEDITENAGREGAISIQKGNNFYVGFGQSGGGVLLNDLHQFYPPEVGISASWQWVDFNEGPGERIEAISFTIQGRAFIGFGYSPTLGIDAYLNDLWEFCPESPDAMWKKCEPLPARGRRSGFGFSIGDFGYIGGGWYRDFGPNNAIFLLNDTWQYIPADEDQ